MYSESAFHNYLPIGFDDNLTLNGEMASILPRDSAYLLVIFKNEPPTLLMIRLRFAIPPIILISKGMHGNISKLRMSETTLS